MTAGRGGRRRREPPGTGRRRPPTEPRRTIGSAAPDEPAAGRAVPATERAAAPEAAPSRLEPGPSTRRSRPPEDAPPRTPAATSPSSRSGAALGDTEPHGFAALDEDDELDDGERRAAEDEDACSPRTREDEELDVLEDTPDFLQETPEHDRLWFEQKPPRDFDFD